MRLLIIFWFLIFSATCVHLRAQTIAERIPTPAGYERIKEKEGSFGYYLQHLPLLPAGSKVLLYDGREKANQKVAYAVIDMEIGKRDLQQCADAIIRLRAEYLYAQERYDEIGFNFTNGFKAAYTKWAKGNRIKVSGNDVSWYQSGKEDYSYPVFRAYLDVVFAYAGTASLARELKKTSYDDMRIGDIFIQGGFPGHAVIVVDMAVHPTTGEKLFLLAQSYMPAQQIHVLVNPNSNQLSPWYSLNKPVQKEVVTPEWVFHTTDLMRF